MCSDGTVRIKAAERTIALLEYATTLFDERLNLVDDFFFIKFFFWCAVGFLQNLDDS